jgi:uncharacterized protein with HEPN domain
LTSSGAAVIFHGILAALHIRVWAIWNSSDHKTNFSVVRPLGIVGEAAKNIPQSVWQKHPEIPWRYMAGVRKKLAHDYSIVKLRVARNTVVDDLPILKDQIHKIIQAYETGIRDESS